MRLLIPQTKTFKGDHRNNVSATLKTLIFPAFENIKAALRILATLPPVSERDPARD